MRQVLLTLVAILAVSNFADARRPASTKAQCVAACSDAVTQTCASFTKHRKFNRCRTKLLNQCRRFGTAKLCPPPTTTTSTLPSGSATTTTTPGTVTTSTTLGSTSSCSMQWCDRGTTVYDTATGLEWEKKTTQIGSGVNPADLHDVDNTYAWAGRCHRGIKLCQPNQAAEDTCDTYTDLPDRVYGCQQCVGDEGPCDIGVEDPRHPKGITTIWDWLNQLNASNYAGHNDWRLPSEAGCNDATCSHAGTYLFHGVCTACQVHELESIVYPRTAMSSVDRDGCLRSPCIDSIFDVTQGDAYWSSTTYELGNNAAWDVGFAATIGDVAAQSKYYQFYVRAVRNGSP